MKKGLFILLFLVICSSIAVAQNEDQFLPSELKQLTAITEPVTLRQGFLRIGTQWNYTGYRNVFLTNAKKQFQAGSRISRSQSFDFSVQYGFTDRIQLSLALPYMMNKVDNVLFYDDPALRSILLENYTVLQTNYDERAYGFSDLSTGIFAQVIEESEKFPSISIATAVSFPSGRKDAVYTGNDSLGISSATGSGEFAISMDLVAKKIIYPYSFDFVTGVSYGFGGEKIFIAGEDPWLFKSGPAFHVSGGANFHLNDWICMTNEMSFLLIGNQEINGVNQEDFSWKIQYTPQIYFQIRKLRLVQGISIPLKGYLIPADPTFILSIQFIF